MFHVGEYFGQASSIPAYAENRCTLPGKQPGRLSTEARRRTGHQHDLALQC
jgi:hypothetical protein